MFGTSGEADYGSCEAALSAKARAVICDIFFYTGVQVMPYCPKCDMEFVEGIKVCSDCGGALVESKEVAEAMKKKEQEEQLAAMAQEMDPFSGEEADAELSEDDPSEKSSQTAEPVHALSRIHI